MELFLSLSPEIQEVVIQTLGVVVTAISTVAVAAFTYWATKRLKFFEVFFAKKTSSYEDFIEVVMSGSGSDLQELAEMAKATAVALLYCPPSAADSLRKFHNTTVELERLRSTRRPEDLPGGKELLAQLLAEKDIVIEHFRKDIRDCRKFNFK